MSYDIESVVKRLLLFSNEDGTITQGFMTQDRINELQRLTGWTKDMERPALTMEDIQPNRFYYIRPDSGVKKLFVNKRVFVIEKQQFTVVVMLDEKAGRFEKGIELHIEPDQLIEYKEEN